MEVTITATVFKKQPNGNYRAGEEEMPSVAVHEIVRMWNETHDNPKLYFVDNVRVVLEMKGELPETALSPASLFR